MTATFRLRRASPEDSRRAFDVFVLSVRDLAVRLNTPWQVDPEELWTRMQPLYDHLAEHAAEWWVAEDPGSGAMIGYARSVERGGLFELSEFFVDPSRQSAGVGAALLERAFAQGRGQVRVIIATTDARAQARYYRAGTAVRFPIVALAGPPRAAPLDPALRVARADVDDIGTLSAIETSVLEFDRGEEFRWLLAQREGYLYRRDGEPIGFSFISARGVGPIAALRAEDQASILAHVESRAAELDIKSLSLEVPMVNEIAMRHLLGRGFQIDTFFTFLMSSRPFGQFDCFIGFAPPFVL